MVTEAAGAVVILAVDIAADSSADSDLTGPRQHRDPQSHRQRRFHQRVETDTAVDIDHSRRRLDGVDPIQRGHIDDQSATVLSVVAIGTAKTAGDHPAVATVGGLGGHPGHSFDDLLGIRGAENLGDAG